MAPKTGISYLCATWQPGVGCGVEKVSAGCENCWAVGIVDRMDRNPKITGDYSGVVKNGWWTGKVQTFPDRLLDPTKWKKPKRIGVWFQGDMFCENAPIDYLIKVFSAMNRAKQHTFLTLTKRPQGALDWCTHTGLVPIAGIGTPSGVWWPENAWFGVSACTQADADRMIPIQLQVPAINHWLSLEPLLGPVLLKKIDLGPPWHSAFDALSGRRSHKREPARPNHESITKSLDWVVVGCESKPGNVAGRPMNLDWVRKIRDDCGEAGVPFYFKQMADSKGRIITEPELDGRQWLEKPPLPEAETADMFQEVE